MSFMSSPGLRRRNAAFARSVARTPRPLRRLPLEEDVVDLDRRPPAADVLRDLVPHRLEARICGSNRLAAIEERDEEPFVPVREHQDLRDTVRLLRRVFLDHAANCVVVAAFECRNTCDHLSPPSRATPPREHPPAAGPGQATPVKRGAADSRRGRLPRGACPPLRPPRSPAGSPLRPSACPRSASAFPRRSSSGGD